MPTHVILDTIVKRESGKTLMYKVSRDILDRLMLKVQKISMGKDSWSCFRISLRPRSLSLSRQGVVRGLTDLVVFRDDLLAILRDDICSVPAKATIYSAWGTVSVTVAAEMFELVLARSLL